MMLLDIAIAIVLAWVVVHSGIDDEITDPSENEGNTTAPSSIEE